MGAAGPPELTDFLLEQEFWQRFGLTREALLQRPHRETLDRVAIINAIRREEQARSRHR